MKTRFLFWALAAPFLCISGLELLLFFDCITSTSERAVDCQKQKVALFKRATVVEDFLHANGQFPSHEDLNNPTLAGNGDQYTYTLFTLGPPVELGFKFPKWPDGKQNFALGCWRGEWFEFYDSHSRTSTLDEQTEKLFWMKDAMKPLAASAILALPPLLLLWLWKKIQFKKSPIPA